jgi:hypothetical protein
MCAARATPHSLSNGAAEKTLGMRIAGTTINSRLIGCEKQKKKALAEGGFDYAECDAVIAPGP